MFALFSRYSMTESLSNQISNIEELSTVDGKDMRQQMMVAVLEVAANVLSYCRSIVSQSGEL